MQTVGHLPGGHPWLLVLVLACGGPQAAHRGVGADRRQATVVPLQVSEAVRTEMRTMLGSLHGVLTASISGDPALEKVLPEGFLQLGITTHRQFDDLAAAIAAGAPRDSIAVRLARLTGSCVSCHETYRLEVR